MNFPSIEIQGSIISSDLLGKIRSEQASFQLGKDFNKDFTNTKLKDDISSAWQDAKGQWTIFQNKIARLREGETGTTETRNFWIVPLLTNLGYNLNYSRQAEEFNGKSFTISYRDSQIDGFPVYIGGFNESLDRRPENKLLRVSPHAMVQEYLNYSEHLYGLVTNGKQLRLLRDASRITRLSYVEFNLQKMMEEDLYSDFVLFYRLLHVSRMPEKSDGGAESKIEKYHQEGLAAGSTIRSKLGDAVKDTIKTLANGFINHPDNELLRTALLEGKLNADDYYHHQLRIIYRLLFLFVIEERNLVYSDNKTPETRRFGQIYYNYYSLLRLRKLARKLPPPDANRNYDLWQSLLSTFAIFEKKEMGEKLGIMSLQGDLFSYSAISNSVYDLHQCRLSNALLIKVLKALGYFENENGVLIAVNYGGLDVEEFGSVYEGLLELKLKFEPIPGSDRWNCDYDRSSERGTSGSHYTPEELVQPLIKHSLEYIIEDRIKPYKEKKATKETTAQSLLSLKICDVACGSGHILLSAARRLALEIARVQTDEDQPNPMAVRKAIKQVVRQCIYGVDKNPLAVELCKVALWLETHNPGEPLNFLDHHIKCGDAIVGLAHRDELEKGIPDEAFKTLPGYDKDIAKTFRDQNIKERKARLTKELQLKAEFEKSTENSVQETLIEYKTFNKLPETTPEEIERKAKAYKKFIDGKGFSFLKAIADTQVAQFFIPKTIANKDGLMTDGEFRQILSGYNQGWQNRKVAKAIVVGSEYRFFHWFLEFPEVFNESGFDCILGNPPYLGGKKISTNFGDSYLNFVKENYSPAGGLTDLVAYFSRRIFSILKPKSFFSIITTNTISQTDTRVTGLAELVKYGTINFAIKSKKWPGAANLEVSLLSIFKGNWIKEKFLGTRLVGTISTYLDEDEGLQIPFKLLSSCNKCYEGTIILGSGFILTENEIEKLIEVDPKYSDVIFEYLSGNDINNSFNLTPARKIINFFDWEEDYVAKKFPLCYNILKEKVKPERDILKRDVYRIKWWKYAERNPKLYSEIRLFKRAITVCRVTKYLNFQFVPTSYIYDVGTNVILLDNYKSIAILNSSHHEVWARKYGSSLESRLRYTNTDCFETFPFPINLIQQLSDNVEVLGEEYHEHRRQLMLKMQLGLTKTYNAFHAKEIQVKEQTTQILKDLDKKIIEKQFGKEVWNLCNHLQKTPGTCSIEEAVEGIIELRKLHVELDKAVLEAYGWGPGSSQPIELRHDFYEVDYLPENDRIRYTIHPEARKEILRRLLDLNHKIHEEEVASGLWDKKKPKEYKTKTSKTSKAKETEEGYGGLFE
jgi:hypothetical protein